MTFLKTEKMCYSDIMGQNWYSYKLTLQTQIAWLKVAAVSH